MCGFGRVDAVDIDTARYYVKPWVCERRVKTHKNGGYTLTDKVRKPNTRRGGDAQPTERPKGAYW